MLDLCHELRRRGGTHARAYRDFLRAICLSDRQRWLPSSPEVDRLGPSRVVGLITDILGAYFREGLFLEAAEAVLPLTALVNANARVHNWPGRAYLGNAPVCPSSSTPASTWRTPGCPRRIASARPSPSTDWG